MKLHKKLVQGALLATLGLAVSGCSAMGEMAGAALEVKSLENQANRAAVGMAIVRENNLMMNKLGISSDAKWPEAIAADVTAEEKRYIDRVLAQDAYYATQAFTFNYQKQILGGYVNMGVSSLTYRAYKNLIVLYGENPMNWPFILKSKSGFKNFLEFEEGKLKKTEAAQGTFYPTLGDAVIALTPENFQKELTPLREAMVEAFSEVEGLNAEQGDLKAQLQMDENEHAKNVKERTPGYEFLTKEEIAKINENIATLEVKIEDAEKVADDKESIYYTKLDEAVEALKSDIKLDDQESVKLAHNVYVASDNIENGSLQAGTMFTTALTLAVTNGLPNFDKELQSLVGMSIGGAIHSRGMSQLIEKRKARLLHNAIYLLPNIAMGSYYAIKQSSEAGKYKDVAGVITEAAGLQEEAKVAQKDAESEAEKGNK